jgi:hypothetical protein
MNKIFGIGLSRTGTTSLTHALSALGYHAIHFPHDPVTRQELAAHRCSPSESLRLAVLKSCDAITDTPACCVYRELDQSYPGSKFIMTVRDRKAWLASCERFWREVLVPGQEQQPDPGVREYIDFIDDWIYGATRFDRERFAAVYDEYTRGVRERFRGREEALLQLDVCGGDGWERLAPFLGAAVPEFPFPHENSLA